MKLVFPVVLVCLAAAQTDQYPRERENVLHPTNPAWRLFQDDTACGGYLWKSDHKSELHRIALYYFSAAPIRARAGWACIRRACTAWW